MEPDNLTPDQRDLLLTLYHGYERKRHSVWKLYRNELRCSMGERLEIIRNVPPEPSLYYSLAELGYLTVVPLPASTQMGIEWEKLEITILDKALRFAAAERVRPVSPELHVGRKDAGEVPPASGNRKSTGCCLLVAREEADRKLQDRIAIGEELERRQIGGREELGHAEADYRQWRTYNSRLLKSLFDTDEMAGRSMPKVISTGSSPTLKGKILWHVRSVRDALARLRSIQNELELIPECAQTAHTVAKQGPVPDARPDETETNPPLLAIEIVDGTRGYVRSMMTQANGCYQRGWYDACAVMLRRLIEVLIVDSFEAKGKLDDILYGSAWPKFSEPPNAAELDRFLREVFVWMEDALHCVSVAYLHSSPLSRYSAAYNWETIKARFADIPTEMDAAFLGIIQVRQGTLEGPRSVTGERLTSAAEAVHRVLSFLAEKFPRAGVNVPIVHNADILPLGRLIDKYLVAPTQYWRVERVSRAGLKMIKRLGDLGAHGRYVQVKRHDLGNVEDQISVSIQQLIATAYPHHPGPGGAREGPGRAGQDAVRDFWRPA